MPAGRGSWPPTPARRRDWSCRRSPPQTARQLRAFLPAAASVGNPVDMLASATPEHYRQAEQILLADDAIDSLLVIFIPPIAPNADEVAAAIVDGRRSAHASNRCSRLS